MKISRSTFFTCVVAGFMFTSCSKNDDGFTEIEDNTVTAPLTYTFTRNGESTVSFSGQTTRILMADAIASSFLDFDTATQASLNAMFTHVEGTPNFPDEALNASDKNVRSKVAASKDYFEANATEAAAIKATFDQYIEDQINEVFPNENIIAAPGVAGQIADGSATRYVAANGLEYNQAFSKGLIGALMVDQMLNNYLSTSVLDEATNIADNDATITAPEKPYTTMEHKWDEAYGYLFGTAATPESPVAAIGEADNFLNKYVGRVNSDPDFNTIAQEIFDALKLGRAAIVAKNYQVRDEQAAIVRQKISEVIAIRAVYYLQNGKIALQNGDMGAAFHDLSEGYGFITSLRFTRNNENNAPYFSTSEVSAFISALLNDGPNGLWNVTPATLDAISQSIAAPFNFTVAQAASTN